VITPSNASVPNSIAHYSVIIGPCLNTATTVLNASRFNPAALSATIGHQCAKGSTVNLLSVVQSTVNGTWFGPGSSVTNNIFSPSGIPTGIIVLTYSTQSSPNLGLCTDVSTIAVSVLNPATPKISNVGPICNNAAAIQLTVTPSTGMWTSSPYLTSNGIFTPSLTSVGNNAVQYVIGTNTCNSQSTKFVSVEAFVSAKITSQLPDQCNNGPGVNLSPFTLNSGGVWSGPGIAGQTFNPSMTGSGTFTLTHNTASSPSGLCPDQDQMAVNVFSLAVPVLTKAGPFCNTSAPVQLTVSPVGGLFGGASMGVVSLAGKFEPAHAAIGNNIINYSITSGPCVAYAQTTVSVEKFISADFEKILSPICLIPGKTNPVNMDSYVQNPGGTWDGKGMIGNMFDPFKANIGKNNVIKYSTHSMPTATLCPDESEITVEVRNVPVVKAFSNITSTCSPAEIIFNTPSATEGTGTWNFDDGSEPGQGFTVSHVYTTPGTYNVTFTYKDDIGCEALPARVNPVTVNEIPKADFSVPDEIFISSPDVQLTNLTTVLGNNTYLWKIGNLYTLDQVNPVVSLPKIGRYQITLVATSILGCKDEISKTIEVKNDFNIYIPTSFSPNFDGLNDVFMPVFSEYGLDHKSFEMEIFDRWGHSLYRTKDVTKGWDGSVQNKGEPLKEEVYIYRIKYKDLDGNAYNKMGHVSLLK
jgi:gliding motility-associated-like protein